MKTIAVIGAGIVGSFLAYDLTQYEEVEVILFEKHGDVAQETSKAVSYTHLMVTPQGIEPWTH